MAVRVDAEIAGAELKSALLKATRMFTRKQFRQPSAVIRSYQAPSKVDPLSPRCENCGRPKSWGSGRYCRECYQAFCRQRYAEKVAQDHARVTAAEAAFQSVIKETMMTAKRKTEIAPITRSTSGLRAALFEEMDALRSGKSDPQRARSIAAMANSILQSVHVEIEYHKYTASVLPKEKDATPMPAIGTDVRLAA